MTRVQFYKFQEQTFDAFAKTVVRNKSIDIIREYTRQAEREIPLDEISISDMYKSASITDSYCLYSKTYLVHNYLIQVHDPVIGELLQYLTPQRRDVILLYYFLNLNDTEIGHLLHIDHTTVNYRRSSTLKRLRKMMEDTENG